MPRFFPTPPWLGADAAYSIPLPDAPIQRISEDPDVTAVAEAAKAYESDDKEAGGKWAKAAMNYSRLLRDHIAKENNVLFVMAVRLLTPAEQEQLASGSDEIEIQKMGKGTHERLHRMMDSPSRK